MPKSSKTATAKKPKPTSESYSEETESSTNPFDFDYDVRSSPTDLISWEQERHMFRDAATAMARKLGRPKKHKEIDPNRTIFLSTQVEPELKALLQLIQDETGMNMSNMLRRALGILIDTYVQIKKEEGALG